MTTDGLEIATIVSGGGSRSGEPTLALSAVDNPFAIGGSNGSGSGSSGKAPYKKMGLIRGGKRGSVIPLALYRKANARYTLVYSHGNATDIGAMHDRCAGIAEAVGVNVLVYDYTGYGCARYATMERLLPVVVVVAAVHRGGGAAFVGFMTRSCLWYFLRLRRRKWRKWRCCCVAFGLDTAHASFVCITSRSSY